MIVISTIKKKRTRTFNWQLERKLTSSDYIKFLLVKLYFGINFLLRPTSVRIVND